MNNDDNCLPLLNYKLQGSGPPVVIAHGLFGMLDNWHTFAKQLGSSFTTISVDLRNHGRSFHTEDMTYRNMANDVYRLTQELGLESFSVIGHSMGGKVACQLALDHPECIDHLIVIDILPVHYERGHDDVLSALNGLNTKNITTRKEAEEKMLQLLHGQKGVAHFLLKSLKRSVDTGFEWRFNLSALTQRYDQIRAGLTGHPFTKKALFVKGERSDYITMETWMEAIALFPSAELISVENAGHWVHADQPDTLLNVVRAHLSS